MIERVRQIPAGIDEYGDPTSVTTVRVELPGAFVAPRESSDLSDRGRAGVIVGLTLYTPAGTDIRHTDRFDVDGILYEVDGEGAVWDHPFSGWRPGVTAALRRVDG